ncbi:MAG TPA: N-acetyltransferase [Hyphomicrobiales bacterium]|nr:N-acetyltransferase [Kaistiaceae bacterium]HQF31760.1 N-acetyltransferase [Hyphomicrobiales bacterium]
MKIRDEIPGDHAVIGRLVADAFRDMPHAQGDEAGIVDRLRAAGDLTLSRVAVIAGEVVGHVAASPVAIGTLEGWVGIGPVAVLPALQRQGIGSALMRDALDRLKAIGPAGVVLVGEPAFYGRLGFAPVEGLTVKDVPPEYVLAVSFGETIPQGEIVFHAAFGLE